MADKPTICSTFLIRKFGLTICCVKHVKAHVSSLTDPKLIGSFHHFIVADRAIGVELHIDWGVS